jgi:hypothetical protein
VIIVGDQDLGPPGLRREACRSPHVPYKCRGPHPKKEFFREAAALLNPDGVFVIGAISTPDLRGIAVANRNATIYHTLGSVFSHVLPAGERYMYYFATNAPQQVLAEVPALQERYRERNIETDGFSPQHYHVQDVLPHHQVHRGRLQKISEGLKGFCRQRGSF